MSKEELRLGDITAKPGEIKNGWIKGPELDLQSLDIPIILANGKHEGPILSITGLVHGTEINGIPIIRRVLREEVDLNELHGAIFAVPVCNPLGFAFHSHASPQDRGNMAALFPGDPNGSVTQRLAHTVWTEVVQKTQYNIDIHHCGYPGMPYAYCKSELAKDKETGDKAKGMAFASGLTLMHQGKISFWGEGVYGSLTDRTMMEGIPSITVEIDNPMGKIMNEKVEVSVRATLNVMKYLKMIPGKIEKQPENVVAIPGECTMRMGSIPKTTRGGILEFEVEPGTFIRKGETLATVYNVFGEKLEEIKMLIDGYIWAQGSSLVSPGQRVTHAVFSKYIPDPDENN